MEGTIRNDTTTTTCTCSFVYMPTCTFVKYVFAYSPLLLILKLVEGWSLERDPGFRRL